MNPGDPVAAYYRAVDDDAPERLRDLFAADGVHVRPGQGTLEGAGEIARYFAEERRSRDTTHTVLRRLADDEVTWCKVRVTGDLPDGPFEGEIISEFAFDADERHITRYRVFRGYRR